MALTSEILKANAVLTGLTEEQIAAITTLSQNDENTVIGAKIGGIPEIIEDGKTGYLFESGNKEALAVLINKASSLSHKDYLEMSNYALKFAQEHFDRAKYYPRLMSFFKGFLK